MTMHSFLLRYIEFPKWTSFRTHKTDISPIEIRMTSYFLFVFSQLPQISVEDTSTGRSPWMNLLIQCIGVSLGAGIMLVIAVFEHDIQQMLEWDSYLRDYMKSTARHCFFPISLCDILDLLLDMQTNCAVDTLDLLICMPQTTL